MPPYCDILSVDIYYFLLYIFYSTLFLCSVAEHVSATDQKVKEFKSAGSFKFFFVPKYFLKMQFRVNIIRFKNFEMLTFGVYILNIFMYFYAHCNRYIRVFNIASISHCSIQNLVNTPGNKF